MLLALGILGLIVLAVAPAIAKAAERCAEPAGRVVAVDVGVEVAFAGGWQAVRPSETLCVGDTLRVGEADRAVVLLEGGAALQLAPDSTVHITAAPRQGPIALRLIDGIVRLFSRRTQAIGVETRFANAMVEGTEFIVQVEPDRARVTVLEGRVRFSNELGALRLDPGDSAVALANQAPEIALRVRPRDAAQWALFYPPLGEARLPADVHPALREAVRLAAEGDRVAATTKLRSIPVAARGAAYHTLEAELLLGQGRPDAALAAIGTALRQAPDDPEALALRSIIATARNDSAAALATAERAVAAAPANARARLALSYAAQANFDIPLAQESLEAAVAAEPRNALAWARLAEVQLMLGEIRAARRSAAAAVDLDPASARAHTVQGFVELARIDRVAARAAFDQALALESYNPLARLGAGLAMIRGGDLAAGREQIELAVALDPDNALLRSYLGKAYLEERRDGLAGDELATAKALDPNDPTPWFYDAIRKQLDNRPVPALADLRRSMALNDDRAVYRSRLLLDQDRASRNVSLARIYNDLGFGRLGVFEATRSLAIDPANPAAHRFLADVYVNEPRTEIARVSELLQAQLLSPVGVGLLQPRLAPTYPGLILSGGPTEVSFNEFNRLFERNGINAAATVEAGTSSTFGEETAVSGLLDRWSLSVGQFAYTSEYLARDADLQRDGVVALAQYQPAPSLSLQAEARRDGRQLTGIEQQLDLPPNPDRHFERTNRLFRAGAHWSPTPGAHTLLSAISARFRETDDFNPVNPTEVVVDDGEQLELQQQVFLPVGSIVAGVSGYRTDRRGSARQPLVDFSTLAVTVGDRESEHGETRSAFSYLYGLFPLGETVDLTLGAALARVEQEDPNFSRGDVLDKVGLTWQATPSLTVRAATFATLKPSLVADQTIEPTQVAGFNQLFDDLDATRSRRYGIGVDYRLADDWSFGLERTRRRLSSPLDTGGEIETFERTEDETRAYLYWTPTDRLAVSAEVFAEDYHSNNESDPIQELDSLAITNNIRYFAPSGLIGLVGATAGWQRVSRPGESKSGDADFLTFDAGVAYRLPGHRGIVSLTARNIFDSDFLYQDDNFRSVQFREARLIPQRTVAFRVTIGF